MGKAEASATLTVHGKTKYSCSPTNMLFMAPWTAILNSFPFWVIVLPDLNAVEPSYGAIMVFSFSATWSSLSAILSQLAD